MAYEEYLSNIFRFAILVVCMCFCCTINRCDADVLRWRFPGIHGEWTDPTNWRVEGTNEARVPLPTDDVVLEGHDWRWDWITHVRVYKPHGGPIVINSLTLNKMDTPCNPNEPNPLSYLQWDGANYQLIGLNITGARTGMVLELVAPTEIIVRQDVHVETQIRFLGSPKDPLARSTLQVVEGSITAVGAQFIGQADIHGNLLADDFTWDLFIVEANGKPTSDLEQAGATVHVHGNLALEGTSRIVLWLYSNSSAGYSQLVVEGDIAFMAKPYLGLRGPWREETPVLIKFNSTSGDGDFLAVVDNGLILPFKLRAWTPTFKCEGEAGPGGSPVLVDNCKRESTRDFSLLLGFSEDVSCGEKCPGTPECSGRGQCVDDGFNTPYCLCNDGWADFDCRIPDCPGTPDCNNKGQCISLNEAVPYCKCLPGWDSVEDCSVGKCPNDCSNTGDHHHGTCELSAVPPRCVCDIGWTLGPELDCSVPLKRCPGLEECSGYGTCDRLTGNCTCVEGRMGSDCSVPSCPGSPQCSHHGECVWKNELARAECECDRGWSGEDCSQAKCPSASEELECSGRGQCVTSLDPPRCLCDAPKETFELYDASPVVGVDNVGYTGEDCSIAVSSCQASSSRCQVNCIAGYCNMEVCPEGWKGFDCTTPVCEGFPECGGHGQCQVSLLGQPTCKCRAGWDNSTGDCLLAQCEVSGCSGNGYCDKDLSPPRCVCEAFFYGPECQFYSGACVGEPECSDHGYCVNGTCVCDDYWEGLDCASPIYDCPNGCSGHGICVPDNMNSSQKRREEEDGSKASGVCKCDNAWAGEDCSQTLESRSNEDDEDDYLAWIIPVAASLIFVVLVLVLVALLFWGYRKRKQQKARSVALRRKLTAINSDLH